MKELIKSILETSNERIKNPLISTYAISFSLFNWKSILILLFSKEDINTRIQIVESSYGSSIWCFLVPLIVSLCYIGILPYIMWAFDVLITKAKKKRKAINFNIIDFDLDERIKLVDKENILELKKAKNRELNDLTTEIEKLNSDIIDWEEKLTKKEDEINGLESELSKLQLNYSIELKDLENSNKEVLKQINKKNEELEIKTNEIKQLQKNAEALRHIRDRVLLNNDSGIEQIDNWENEYVEFTQSSTYLDYFDKIGYSIIDSEGYLPFIDSNTLDVLQSNGIIIANIDKRDIKGKRGFKYDFTSKGRFFWNIHIGKINIEDKRKS